MNLPLEPFGVSVLEALIKNVTSKLLSMYKMSVFLVMTTKKKVKIFKKKFGQKILLNWREFIKINRNVFTNLSYQFFFKFFSNFFLHFFFAVFFSKYILWPNNFTIFSSYFQTTTNTKMKILTKVKLFWKSQKSQDFLIKKIPKILIFWLKKNPKFLILLIKKFRNS